MFTSLALLIWRNELQLALAATLISCRPIEGRRLERCAIEGSNKNLSLRPVRYYSVALFFFAWSYRWIMIARKMRLTQFGSAPKSFIYTTDSRKGGNGLFQNFCSIIDEWFPINFIVVQAFEWLLMIMISGCRRRWSFLPQESKLESVGTSSSTHFFNLI